VKVLRLGNSNDRALDLPEHLRSWRIAEGVLAEATGEPVETVIREIWPTSDLPDLIDGWIRRYEPDLVILKQNSYWTSAESVPLRLERLFGRAGKALGKAGTDAVERPIGQTRGFRLARRVLLKTIGGDSFFEPEQVLAVMEQCLRRIVAHEELVVVVQGSAGRAPGMTGRGGRERRLRRRTIMHEGMSRICAGLRVTYFGTDKTMSEAETNRLRGADGTHRGVEGQRADGLTQGRHMAEAWLAAHGRTAAKPG